MRLAWAPPILSILGSKESSLDFLLRFEFIFSKAARVDVPGASKGEAPRSISNALGVVGLLFSGSCCCSSSSSCCLQLGSSGAVSWELNILRILEGGCGEGEGSAVTDDRRERDMESSFREERRSAKGWWFGWKTFIKTWNHLRQTTWHLAQSEVQNPTNRKMRERLFRVRSET